MLATVEKSVAIEPAFFHEEKKEISLITESGSLFYVIPSHLSLV